MKKFAGHHPWLAAAPVLVCAILIASCATQAGKPAAVPEIRPGILAGYLSADEIPDSVALVPVPPASGSTGFAQDEAVYLEARALRGTPRWEQASLDAVLSFPQAAGTFECALNAPVNERDTPRLYTLLRRSLVDAGRSTSAAKNHYKRTRPFVAHEETSCAPDSEAILRMDGSYPSGHAAIGWAWALILTEAASDRADAVLARGRSYGESRLVCNVHWQSDILQGRFMGASLVARLHANATFRDDLEAARSELAAVHANGLKPARDCDAEAAALGQKLSTVL